MQSMRPDGPEPEAEQLSDGAMCASSDAPSEGLEQCLAEAGLCEFAEVLSHRTMASLLSSSIDHLDEVAHSAGMKWEDRNKFVQAIEARRAQLDPEGDPELRKCLAEAGLKELCGRLSNVTLAELLGKSEEELRKFAYTVGITGEARKSFMDALGLMRLDPGLRQCLLQASLTEFSRELSGWKLAELISKRNDELEDVADEVGMKRLDRTKFLQAMQGARSVMQLLSKARLSEFADMLVGNTVGGLLSTSNEDLVDLADDMGMKRVARDSFLKMIEERRRQQPDLCDPDLRECLAEEGLDEFCKALSDWTLLDLLRKTNDELEDLGDSVGMKMVDRRTFLRAISAKQPFADQALVDCLAAAGLESCAQELSAYRLEDLVGMSKDDLDNLADTVGLKMQSRRSFLSAIGLKRPDLASMRPVDYNYNRLRRFQEAMEAWRPRA